MSVNLAKRKSIYDNIPHRSTKAVQYDADEYTRQKKTEEAKRGYYYDKTSRNGPDLRERGRFSSVSDGSRVVFFRPRDETSVSNGVSSDSFIDSERAREHQRRSINYNLEQNRADWNVKAQRFYRQKRYARIKNSVLAVSVVSCFAGTLLQFRAQYQIMMYIALLGVVVMADPFGAVGRFLALPMRALVSFDCACLVLLGLTGRIDVFLVTACMIGITVFLIRTVNESLLTADCWRDTEAVDQAIRRDPEGMAEGCWQGQGRREAATALRRMGIDADENMVDYLGQTVFKVGYSHGLDKTRQVKAMANKLDQAKEEATIAAERIERLEAEAEEQTAEVERLQYLQKEADGTGEHYKKMYQQLLKENEQLQSANNELLQAFIDADPDEEQPAMSEAADNIPDNVVEIPHLKLVKTEQEIVIEALQEGLSYQKAADRAGISKSKAYRLAEEYRNQLLQAQGM